MKLMVVCRGSASEGLGHLFRARTFARAATKRAQVHLVCIAPAHLHALFDDAGCQVDLVEDASRLGDFARDARPDVCVLDMTSLPEATVRELKASVPHLVSISPVFSHMELLDAVFTRSTRPEPVPRIAVHGGLKYAIFSDSCHPIDQRTFSRHLKRPELPVAVCMGGTDAANTTLRVLRELVKVDRPCTFWTLLGEGYEHSYAQLVEVVRDARRHEVVLASTSRSMWTVMGNCVLAVTAGGLTALEAVYAGLPAITLLASSDRRSLMAPLYEIDAILDGGVASDPSLANLGTLVNELHANRKELQAIRDRCRGLVDDRGAERTLDVIEEAVQPR
jgi:spore coat polysaccharide biosynthesis predicted glycosyltransferase SpsG